MKITKTEKVKVVEYEYNFTLNEDQTFILLKILRNIAGISQWRNDLLEPMQQNLYNLIDREKYENFSRLNNGVISHHMELRNSSDD